MTWNVRLFAKHVKSEKNNFADALSRNQMDRFHRDTERKGKIFNSEPEEIPSELWPVHKLWLNN